MSFKLTLPKAPRCSMQTVRKAYLHTERGFLGTLHSERAFHDIIKADEDYDNGFSHGEERPFLLAEGFVVQIACPGPTLDLCDETPSGSMFARYRDGSVVFETSQLKQIWIGKMGSIRSFVVPNRV